MLVEIEGVVESAGETQSFGDKGFRKRTLVIKTDADWGSLFPVDLTKENCDIDVAEGDSVVVDCYVNGSNELWKGRAFLSLTARDINVRKREQDQTNSDAAATEAPF